MSEGVVLPYAGTSGWSGSQGSRDRAVSADTTGRTAKNQSDTLKTLRSRQERGVTWKELGALRGWHHGTASGVLSVLHKTGLIKRLSERRDRCHVYVLPEYVLDRVTEDHGRSKACPHCGGKL